MALNASVLQYHAAVAVNETLRIKIHHKPITGSKCEKIVSAWEKLLLESIEKL